MRLWIVQFQCGNRHWLPWGLEWSEEEADACAESVKRTTGWNIRVREFVPVEAARNAFDIVLNAAFLAAADDGICRREFAASLQKHSGFKTLHEKFRAEAAKPIHSLTPLDRADSLRSSPTGVK